MYTQMETVEEHLLQLKTTVQSYSTMHIAHHVQSQLTDLCSLSLLIFTTGNIFKSTCSVPQNVMNRM